MTPKALELDLLAAELPDWVAAELPDWVAAQGLSAAQGRSLVEQPSWGPERLKWKNESFK